MIGDEVSKLQTEAEDDVKWWLSEIDRGIAYRKPYVESYERNLEFEDMSQWADDKGYRKGEGDEVTINKIGSYLRTRVAVLGYKNPVPKYTPLSSDGYDEIQVPMIGPDGTPMIDPIDGGIMTHGVLRYKARESLARAIVTSPMFGLRETMVRNIKACDLAYGALKVGFAPTFSTRQEEDGEQEIPFKDGKMDLSGFVTNPVDGSLVTDESDERLISREKIPVWEDWFIDYVDFRRIIFDPDCSGDLNQVRWVVEEEIRPLSDVKEDKLFKNTKDLKASDTDKNDERLDTRPDIYEDPKIKEKHDRVRLFHIWDRVNDKYMVLADGHGKWLRNGKTPRGVYEDPYGFCRNNEKLGEVYQRANVTDLVPIAMQYNIAFQQLMRAMQRATRKVFVDSRAMDSINKDKFESNEDMALIPIDTTKGKSLGEVVMAFTPPPVPGEVFASLDRIDKDFYEVAGLPPEAVGAPKSETATQANMMNAYSGTRIETDRQLLGSQLRVIFKKLDDSIEANMTQPRAVNLIGVDGTAFTGMIDPAEITGDFDVSIDVEEMAPSNTAMEGAQWIQASQVVSAAPWMVADPILAEAFCEKFNIKNDRYVEALSSAAQMQIQMTMPPPQPSVPESGPPQSEADAISQAAAGGQIPRNSSAP